MSERTAPHEQVSNWSVSPAHRSPGGIALHLNSSPQYLMSADRARSIAASLTHYAEQADLVAARRQAAQADPFAGLPGETVADAVTIGDRAEQRATAAAGLRRSQAHLYPCACDAANDDGTGCPRHDLTARGDEARAEVDAEPEQVDVRMRDLDGHGNLAGR